MWVDILLKYLSILFQENILENTFPRNWNQTHDLRLCETKCYALTNWATNASRRKSLMCDSDQTWVFLLDRGSQMGKVKALSRHWIINIAGVKTHKT